MKTAMQLLIESLQEVKKELNTKWDGDPLARRGIVIAMNEATKLLKKEKEQMIEFGLYVKKNGWVGCKIEDMFEDYNNQNK
jgi:hypothetical protein